ncbi:tRNA (N6-isopentenyl adenosine(37)-C2)-methylthiotransferase MiaB [Brachybacterium sp. JHP9]|uniref:tRNA-2-methylthio-N(6)-dimethylallyladenosine synthase n=1 Tax=Brachybacterium equifaecis TaxID=2910770 RepID=A0ABT0QWN9_9MICO|nr:tRNA (N6-isopentenyl adenosine(37)-C2)-methylthiotransferase MiaB [Brachybacterium equifaecis]MCL6422072.1 tRNA (N6-isopentenyl adenosine(37)-C2)-methylthiotransferase MiaB [Brachybacterium equifaecis]
MTISAHAPAPGPSSAAAAPPPAPESSAQERGTYQVRTFGCQMNVHDSERLTGMLEDAGYAPAPAEADPRRGEVDVVVFNTCAVRENADKKLYGTLGSLRAGKSANPGMQIAVGGCLAQKDRSAIVDRAPWVDVVFGTHNIGSLPVLLERSRHNAEAQVEILESLEVFPSTLPTRRESVYAAWVSISVGCNNTCTFCIVPSLRGVEKDRRPGDVLAEIRGVVEAGAIEVTLLGQNVNSYGVEFGDRGAFAKLLRACGEIEGLERVRFTSPHPAMFTDDVIDAMAQTPNVMPTLHMPLQSGSDAVLRRMRRSYRSAKFLGILDRVRAQIPDAAISTDIIVGFPGETEEDFQRTLEVVEASRFASAFTFQYSIRPGTPAATMEDQLPKEVVQERYERLTALQDRITFEGNAARVGREVEVLIAEGEGTRDALTHRISGRSADNRLVHLSLQPGLPVAQRPRPGDIVATTITRAAPFYLIADAALAPAAAGVPWDALGPEVFAVRRTASGDAWEAGRGVVEPGAAGESAGACGTGGACGTAGPAPAGPVVLGLPEIRRR